MAARARKQIERLSSLFPVLMQTLLSHPQTAVYAKKQGEPTTKDNDAAPMALTWAFAMVRSRAFAANDNLFAFVPFLVSTYLSLVWSLLCCLMVVLLSLAKQGRGAWQARLDESA